MVDDWDRRPHAAHCAVAIDEAGRQLGRPMTVRATDAGHRQLMR